MPPVRLPGTIRWRGPPVTWLRWLCHESGSGLAFRCRRVPAICHSFKHTARRIQNLRRSVFAPLNRVVIHTRHNHHNGIAGFQQRWCSHFLLRDVRFARVFQADLAVKRRAVCKNQMASGARSFSKKAWSWAINASQFSFAEIWVQHAISCRLLREHRHSSDAFQGV